MTKNDKTAPRSGKAKAKGKAPLHLEPPPKKAEAPKKLEGPFTLAIDIGGTGLKASVLDKKGVMTTERVRIDTPQPCNPKLLLEGLADLGRQLQALGQRWDRISVGFPGLIRHGKIVTAPNLGNDVFGGFDLGSALSKKLGAPVRAVNDADMQGLAAITGKGVEMVCTLGTGFGTALFQDGRLQTHLEISQHPFRKGETYDQQLGDRARKAVGTAKWLKRVDEAVVNMATLTGYDRLYLGGGNAKRLDEANLPKNVALVDNAAGILGGIKLWDDIVGDV